MVKSNQFVQFSLPWNSLTQDGLAEHCSSQNVTDRAVGRQPHLLELELLDAFFVGGDGGALDGHVMLQGGVGRVDRDLVVRLIAIRESEIVVQALDIQVGEDQLVLDHLPDDPGHLVAVHLHDGLRHLDPLAGGVCNKQSLEPCLKCEF